MKSIDEQLHIRFATLPDTAIVLSFIQALAKYERLEHEVVATEALLKESLFGKNPQAEVIIAFAGSTPIGFALFFSNYSTFLGKAGLHLEDLFVLEEYKKPKKVKILYLLLLKTLHLMINHLKN